jgi:sulfotransferase
VRDLPWVIDSIERLVQRNVFSPSSIFNYSAGGTVYTRANGVAGQDGMVGAPYDALKQACLSAQRERLLLVQYDTLTTDPAKTVHAICELRARRLRHHRIRRSRRHARATHRKQDSEGRAARDLDATGPVQPFCQ